MWCSMWCMRIALPSCRVSKGSSEQGRHGGWIGLVVGGGRRVGQQGDLQLCAHASTAGTSRQHAKHESRVASLIATPAVVRPYLGARQVARVHDEVCVLRAFGAGALAWDEQLLHLHNQCSCAAQRAAREHLQSAQQFPAVQLPVVHLVQQAHSKVCEAGGHSQLGAAKAKPAAGARGQSVGGEWCISTQESRQLWQVPACLLSRPSAGHAVRRPKQHSTVYTI